MPGASQRDIGEATFLTLMACHHLGLMRLELALQVLQIAGAFDRERRQVVAVPAQRPG